MIRNRLKELMVESHLKASRVANDIDNLSRNTINSTVSNKGKMIQLETINSLCQYLGVTPDDFFEYLPFDVNVSVSSDEDLSLMGNEEDAVRGHFDPFYLNLYLTKEQTNQSTGTIKKTFELSIVLEKQLDFEINSDNFNHDFHPTGVAEFKVVLGNPPLETKSKQAQEFDEFWNKELTRGFRQDIQETIKSKLIDYFNQQAKDRDLESWFDFSSAPLLFVVNYRFNEVIKTDTKLDSGPTLWLQDDSIKDEDLPF